MPNVDLFIPCAPKDYIKLPYVLDSVDRYLPDIHSVHIVAPTLLGVESRYSFPIYLYSDREVLDFDYTRFKFRPTWVYQQFLKLFQAVTADWFLVMDADRFINKPLRLFDGDTPIMFLRDRDEHHDPYFTYSQKMIGVGKVYPHSFLSECTLYSRSLIEDMLLSADLTPREWLVKSAEIIDATCCIADAELYGSFVYSKYPDVYHFQVLRDCMAGKYAEQGEWTAEEIAAYVADMAAREDVDFFTAHSWHD